MEKERNGEATRLSCFAGVFIFFINERHEGYRRPDKNQFHHYLDAGAGIFYMVISYFLHDQQFLSFEENNFIAFIV